MTGAIDLLRLHRLLDQDATLRDLRRYFEDTPPPGRPYTGRRFESLSGGGDRPETANRFTADDLAAVTTLSVSVPAEVAIQILDESLGNQLADYLAKIPTSTALADDDADQHITTESPAQQAWRLLMDCHGISWVTASKLLARKRPHLLPVYDDVVRCALQHPVNDNWAALRAALRADGNALDQKLHGLREAAEIDPRVSALRVLDVALWMRHHSSHTRKHCGGPA
jgi:hypothetical protein